MRKSKMNAGKLNRKHIMKETPLATSDKHLLIERKGEKLMKSCSPLGKSKESVTLMRITSFLLYVKGHL